MLKIIREEGETIDHFLRRYNEGLKRLNFFKFVKQSNIHTRKVSKRQKKASALYKLRKKGKMEYLKLIGKIEDDNWNTPSYYRTTKVKKAA